MNGKKSKIDMVFFNIFLILAVCIAIVVFFGILWLAICALICFFILVFILGILSLISPKKKDDELAELDKTA